MPRNVAGKPIDPTDRNRADGFSPGSQITTYVPGLEPGGKTGAVPITDIGAYTDRDAPVVVIDAAERQALADLDRARRKSIDYHAQPDHPARRRTSARATATSSRCAR